MIDAANTARALARITDEGLFEQLATAVLREANPLCATLTHPGINADGKTITGPLDGVSFVPNADPPHLIAVQHTITSQKTLRRKWLDSSNAAEPGDLLKTAAIVTEERGRKSHAYPYDES
jgi:hypothetical protein